MDMVSFDEAFSQLQHRSTKYVISDSDIENVKRKKLEEYDNEECDEIWRLHKELLTDAMKNNDSNEVGYLINLVDWECIVVYGTDNGISLRSNPDAQELFVEAPKNSLLFFHNHPKNTTLSEQDLNTFLSSDSIKTVSAITNNGRQYFLTKTEGYDKDVALNEYDRIFTEKGEGSVKEFLRVCRKWELIFEYGGL